MIKRFLRENWPPIALAAAIGIFMTLATTIIWPAQGPTVINRIGVATYTDTDGQTYYCFQLAENQYNDTVFPSEFWGDTEIVLVPAPDNYEAIAVSKGEGASTHVTFLQVPSGFNQTMIHVGNAPAP